MLKANITSQAPLVRTSKLCLRSNLVARSSRLMFERDDCSVKALALTTSMTYEQAHRALARCGREDNKGAYEYQWKAAYYSSGYKLKKMSINAKTTKTLVKEVDSGTYLVHTSGHLAVCDNNMMLDFTEGRKFRILNVYRIEDQ